MIILSIILTLVLISITPEVIEELNTLENKGLATVLFIIFMKVLVKILLVLI